MHTGEAGETVVTYRKLPDGPRGVNPPHALDRPWGDGFTSPMSESHFELPAAELPASLARTLRQFRLLGREEKMQLLLAWYAPLFC